MEYIRGQESLLFIKREGDLGFLPVACLTSSPFSESVEMMETTTRENAGWKTSLPTLQSYSLNIEGVMTKDDSDSGNNVISYHNLRTIKRNREKIEWKITTLNGWYVDSGFAHITEISKTDEIETEISFSATLEGFGMPTESTEKVYALGNEGGEIITHGENNNNLIPTE